MKTLWCVMSPKGRFITDTLRGHKQESLDALFDSMPESFRTMFWKLPKESRGEYARRGYRAIKVKIEPA